jgi:hypothetical protein
MGGTDGQDSGSVLAENRKQKTVVEKVDKKESGGG